MNRALRTALASWAVITFLVIASLIAIQLRSGREGFELFIQQWALTNLTIMLASTALTWLCLGALLYLLTAQKVNVSNAFTVAGFFLLAFVYLNVLRERFRYGDYAYYIEAATALLEHKPLPDTYLYLPLWATLLQFIVPLGDQGVLLVLWVLNMLALGMFYLLLQRLLERYGFSSRFAAVTALLFLLVNAPVQRTLGFVQVNLLVMVCILFSMLFYPQRAFLSALTLALAVHLKTSPAVLVLAFLLERDWRWLGWFGLSFLGLAAIPIAINGISPYYDYLHNIYALTQIADTNFHETSFDSFFRFLNPFLRIDIIWTRVMIYAAKVLLGLATLLVMARNVGSGSFFGGDERGRRMLNAVPALCVFMTLSPPIVWDHHGIFVTASFLLLLKCIDAPAGWTWFGLAYFLQFVVPSFDFFPWSYGRLLAPMIVLGLMWTTSQAKQPTEFFRVMNHWFPALPMTKAARVPS